MIKACFDVWCDLCGEPSQATAGGSEARADARRIAKSQGFEVLRVDGALRDVCQNCMDEHGGSNGARARLRVAFS